MPPVVRMGLASSSSASIIETTRCRTASTWVCSQSSRAANSRVNVTWSGGGAASSRRTPAGVTVTNYVGSYDTWASMSHLLAVEQWPDDDPPATIAYFCSSMAAEAIDDPSDADQPRRALARATAEAVDYLDRHVAHYWPNAVDADGRFRWDFLFSPMATGGSGSQPPVPAGASTWDQKRPAPM